MKPPPPGPATNGMVTPSVLAVATAASIALPPCLSTSMPAWLASGSMEATAPPVPTATGSLAAPGRAWPTAVPARETEEPEARRDSADIAETATKRRMSTSAGVARMRRFLSVVLRSNRI